jgi:uncharacterized protein YndB with AHSA1/START domain
MKTTRKHVCQIELAATPETVFQLLITPSAIRQWWQASRAIVDPRKGGVWGAAWGSSEDDPDYTGFYRIGTFDPPRRMIFSESTYYAKSGPLPFQADFVVEFLIRPSTKGCVLQVTQDGFPADSVADDFYNACEIGWKNTFEGIRKYLESRKK